MPAPCLCSDSWEMDMFAGAYTRSPAADKVKYGALNITCDVRGVTSAHSYGDSYLLLKRGVLRLLRHRLRGGAQLPGHVRTLRARAQCLRRRRAQGGAARRRRASAARCERCCGVAIQGGAGAWPDRAEPPRGRGRRCAAAQMGSACVTCCSDCRCRLNPPLRFYLTRHAFLQ